MVLRQKVTEQYLFPMNSWIYRYFRSVQSVEIQIFALLLWWNDCEYKIRFLLGHMQRIDRTFQLCLCFVQGYWRLSVVVHICRVLITFCLHVLINSSHFLFSRLMSFRSWHKRLQKSPLCLLRRVFQLVIWFGPRCQDTPGGLAWWPQTLSSTATSSRSRKVRLSRPISRCFKWC